MTRMKRILFWVGGIFLLLALNFIRDQARNLSQIVWEPVERTSLYRTVSSPGVIEAIRVETMKSEVTELVVKIVVKEGEAVRKGQLLMELSRTRSQIEFEQSKSTYDDALSEYKKAVRELKIQRELYANQAVPRSDVDEAVRNLKKTRTTKDIQQQEFAIAKKKRDSTNVRSPMNGMVLKIHTFASRRVAPDQEIVTVGDISKFVVRAKVDELEIRDIRIGQPVDIQADAYPGLKIKGIVQSIATQAEREAFAKIEVLIEIVESGEILLKHNLSVRSHILIEEIPDSIGIPTKIIQRKVGTHAWVLVKNKLGLIREKKIVLGKPAGDLIEVLAGLKEGQQVGLYSPQGDSR